MKVMGPRRGIAVAVTLFALGVTGVATAGEDPERGIDPNQGESLVEVTLPSKAAAMRLQLDADTYGVEFNDHYLRNNGDGTVTVTVFGTEDELAALSTPGYDARRHDRGPRHLARAASPTARRRCGPRTAPTQPPLEASGRDRSRTTDEIVVLRVDYFENYAGRFLSVEAKDRARRRGTGRLVHRAGAVALVLEHRAPARRSTRTPRVMNVNIDPDTTPDTYIEHRELVRIGDAGTTSPAAARRGSASARARGAVKEAPVQTWLGGGLPPMNDDLPEGLHDPLHGPDRGLRALRASSRPSSRTSPS